MADIAPAGQPRTDGSMPHPLDTAIRNGHAVARIRSPYAAPRTVMAAAEAAVDGHTEAQVVPLPRRDPRPARDGIRRCGAIAPLDGQNRVSLAKVLVPLGWDASTALVATCRPREVVITAAIATAPTLTAVPVDDDRRLTLPPTVTGALDVGRGEQVVAVAVPATGELHLRAAADVLQQVTGALEVAVDEPTPAQAAPAGRARRRRVTQRWAPPPS
jgi:hypothetical protein